LRYADTIGASNIVSALDRFAAEHPRLAPSEELRRRASERIPFLEPFLERPTATAGRV
jgi:hypothetical protein